MAFGSAGGPPPQQGFWQWAWPLVKQKVFTRVMSKYRLTEEGQLWVGWVGTEGMKADVGSGWVLKV